MVNARYRKISVTLEKFCSINFTEQMGFWERSGKNNNFNQTSLKNIKNFVANDGFSSFYINKLNNFIYLGIN